MDRKALDTIDIKKAFQEMKSKEDFLGLLNNVQKIHYGEKYIHFKLQQLTALAYQKDKKRYETFSVEKKNGTERIIYAPIKRLKAVQTCLNYIFQAIYTPHKACMGFVKGKSIIDNAKVHVNNIYVYNIDLKDFFISIDQARVWARLKLSPFELENKKELLNLIVALCCTEIEVERLDENNEWCKVRKNVLPQGAPTSPIISNIVCEKLDIRLTGLAKRFGLRYTRYGDDITFSSMHNVYQKNGEFEQELHRIIADQHFHIQETKTRLEKDSFRQMVTGLVVNEKVNVPQKYVKEIRKWLYTWEQYGYNRANNYFSKQSGKGNLDAVLMGKLLYLRMVVGKENPLFLKLWERWEKLNSLKNDLDMDNILTIWENEGIEKAMEIYYAHAQ